MLRNLFSHFFGQTLYIQIWSDRLRVVNCNNNECFDEPALIALATTKGQKERVVALGNEAKKLQGRSGVQVISPFVHPRTLLADFSHAELLLSQVFSMLNKASCQLLPPRAVMQAMEKTEGGLTQIEGRALRELALGAGARAAALYSGTPLDTDVDTLNALFQ